MPTISTNIQPNVFAPAAPGPAQLSHGPAKSADITRQIAAALPRIAREDLGSAPMLHISLDPATLGTITIKVAQHASGETSVTLTASQPETLAALRHDAQNLGHILTNAGIPEANRQVNFQTMPVAATQAGPGLANAGGQPAGSQFGQGNGNTQQQQQQPGTPFASSLARPVTTSVLESVARPSSTHADRGVDVIA